LSGIRGGGTTCAGELRPGGRRYDVASGDLYAYDGESRLFELIDRQMAGRPAARVARVSGADAM